MRKCKVRTFPDRLLPGSPREPLVTRTTPSCPAAPSPEISVMPARLGYRVVQVSSEEEGYRGSQLVETGPQAKGWLTAKYCIYPQSLVLALDKRTTVDKLQIMGQPWAVTTRLEIWIGDVPKGSEVDVNKAYFMKVGEFAMESNEDNDFTARQLQCVEVVGCCWLLEIF